jgi:hypothetical protein
VRIHGLCIGARVRRSGPEGEATRKRNRFGRATCEPSGGIAASIEGATCLEPQGYTTLNSERGYFQPEGGTGAGTGPAESR